MPESVFPALRERTAMAVDALSREGSLEVGAHETPWSVSVDGVTFAVAVDATSKLVTTARHQGGADGPTRAVLDQMAAFAEGAPVQEVVEHAAVYALDRLLDRSMPRPVEGILTPRNAGPQFAVPIRLMRALRERYFTESGETEIENHFDRPYSNRWLSLDVAGKAALIKPEMSAYLNERGLTGDDLFIHEIDKYDRVILVFGPNVPADVKPPLLMELERRLRAVTGERIELFAEPAKDDNKIRRL